MNYFTKGINAFKNKEYNKAINYFKEQVSEKDTCSFYLYLLSIYNMGVCYMKNKENIKDALDLFKKCFKEEKNNLLFEDRYNCIFNIIVANCKLDNYSNALIYLNLLNALILKQEENDYISLDKLNEYKKELNNIENKIMNNMII